MRTKFSQYFFDQLLEHGQKALVGKKMVVTYRSATAGGVNLRVEILDDADQVLCYLPEVMLPEGDSMTVMKMNQMFEINIHPNSEN